MALGTITVQAQAGKAASAPVFEDVISFPGDSSYPTGGTAGFTAAFRAATGIKEARTILGVEDVAGVAGYVPVFDHANDKLLVFVRTTGVETANAVNLSGTTFRVKVTSK